MSIASYNSSSVANTSSNLNVNSLTSVSSQIISASNQLVFGSGSTSTVVNVPTPSATRVLTVYDAGGNCEVELGIKDRLTFTSSSPSPSSVLASDSGKVIYVSAASTNVSLNMPALQAGLQYTFLVTGTLSGTVSINCPTTSLYGTLIGVSGTNVAKTAETTIILGAGCVAGDQVVLNYTASQVLFKATVANANDVTFSP